GDRARDRLADPPRRVRRELEALRVVELLDRAHETEVAFLDQVQEQHAATDISLRDRHDQAQVRLDQFTLRLLAVTRGTFEAPTFLEVRRVDPAQRGQVGELLRRETAGLDSLRQRHFLRRGEQRDAADLLQVHPYRIGRRAARAVVDTVGQQTT